MPRKNTGPRLRWLEKRGAFYIIWYEGGVERSRSTGSSDRRVAEIALQNHIAGSHRPDGPADPAAYPIADALALYGAGHAATVADPARIGYAIDALLPFWGDRKVGDITPSLCQKYARDRGKSDGTIRRELAAMRAAIRYAVREGHLARAVEVTLPAKPPHRDRFLTHKEAARLLNAARQIDRVRGYLPLFILIALYTGARKEAILSLNWSQINMTTRRIDFAKGHARTKKGRALLPIPNKLFTFLALAWRRRSSDIGPVLHIDGRSIGSIKTSWRTATQRAGLSGITPHTLRHTCATWLAQDGVSLWDIAGWLGQSIATTTELYAHHHPDYMEQALRAANRTKS